MMAAVEICGMFGMVGQLTRWWDWAGGLQIPHTDQPSYLLHDREFIEISRDDLGKVVLYRKQLLIAFYEGSNTNSDYSNPLEKLSPYIRLFTSS